MRDSYDVAELDGWNVYYNRAMDFAEDTIKLEAFVYQGKTFIRCVTVKE